VLSLASGVVNYADWRFRLWQPITKLWHVQRLEKLRMEKWLLSPSVQWIYDVEKNWQPHFLVPSVQQGICFWHGGNFIWCSKGSNNFFVV